MKVKYQQIYSNECGLCAIKNLLKTYNIPFRKIELIYDENGTTILNMAKELKKYFFEVEAISFDIDQLKNIKSFSPYITLIRKNNIAHYVVIFKVDKKYIYILDSLYKKSYKLTYSEFNEVDMKLSLVPNNKKLIKFELKNNKKIFIMPLITLIESFLLLSTTILIQQIIDNGIKNARIP